eukprot:TRINITY_DN2923_c0_g1_i1.p1 TRINITY_DN2923_c0_g1~~TRINITY_DN2923_c0_g1_i1.p1  ORF type:complete len:642 (+),score=110.26 TRINITY_DN2923_c0_g1_i1:41-1966(+)
MGSIYKGTWPIKDSSIEFIIDIKDDNVDTSDIKAESIWIDLSHGIASNVNNTNLSMITRLWTVNSATFCPILEFLAQIQEYSNEIFQDCMASLISKALVPTILDPNSIDELVQDENDESGVFARPDIFLEKMEIFELEDSTIKVEDGVPANVIQQSVQIVNQPVLRKSIPFNNYQPGQKLQPQESKNPNYEWQDEAESNRVEEKKLGNVKLENLGHESVGDKGHVLEEEEGGEAYEGGEAEEGEENDGDNHYFVDPGDQNDEDYKVPGKRSKQRKNTVKLKAEEKKDFCCTLCPKSFATEKRLYKHCTLKHRRLKDQWPKIATSTGTEHLSLSDMLKRRRDLICGVCYLPLQNYYGLVKHERGHTESYVCILCGVPCHQPDKLIEHTDTEHPDMKDFLCRICGFFAYNDISLKRHNKEIHQENSSEYSCEECTFVTHKYSTFKAHTRLHKVNKEMGKKFVCDECGKEFPTISKIKNHKKSHAAERNAIYNCNYCPKRFHQISVLRIHERTHTGERPFECQDCGLKFGSRSTLIKHKDNVHTSLEDMPYKCEECGKGFSKSRRKLYLGHLKQHSGIKDHACPLCSATFSCRAYLSNHFKKVHKQKLTEVENDTVGVQPTLGCFTSTTQTFQDPDNQITISIV